MSSQTPPSLTEINEKLDRILVYQRVSTIWGTVKGFVWLGIITLIFILPLYYAYDFFQHPGEYIDLNQFKEFQKTMEETMKQLKQP